MREGLIKKGIIKNINKESHRLELLITAAEELELKISKEKNIELEKKILDNEKSTEKQ